MSVQWTVDSVRGRAPRYKVRVEHTGPGTGTWILLAGDAKGALTGCGWCSGKMQVPRYA